MEIGLGGQLPRPVEQGRAVAVALAVERLLDADLGQPPQRGVEQGDDEQAGVARAAPRQVEDVAERLAQDERGHGIDPERAEDGRGLLHPAHQEQVEIVEPVARQRRGEGGGREQQRDDRDELRPARQLARAERPGQVVQQDERREPEKDAAKEPSNLRAPRPGRGTVGSGQHEDRCGETDRQEQGFEPVAHLERRDRIFEGVSTAEAVRSDPPRDREDHGGGQVREADPPAAGGGIESGDHDAEVEEQRGDQRAGNDVGPVDRAIQQVAAPRVAEGELGEHRERKERKRGPATNLRPAERDQQARDPEGQADDGKVRVGFAAGAIGDLHHERDLFGAAKHLELQAVGFRCDPAELVRIDRRSNPPTVGAQQEIALANPRFPARGLGIDLECERALGGLDPLHPEHRDGGLDAVQERDEAEAEQGQRGQDDQGLAKAEADACHDD